MLSNMESLENKISIDIADLRAPGAGCVRIGPVAAVPALLNKYADEPADQIVAEVGLDLELFEDPQDDISFITVGRLLNLCAKRTGLPHFGLLLGQQGELEKLGHFGELAIYAPTVEAALHGMILHVCSNDRGGVPTLRSKNGIARLGYAIYVPMHEGASQIYSTSITIMYNLLRVMCGKTFTVAEVRFSHSQPNDMTPYEVFFQAPLIFGADDDAIIFSDQWLKKPLPGANKELYTDVLQRLSTIDSGMGVDLLEKIRMILRPMIVSQHCSLERLASALSLHPRTLNRRLKERGTNFREMVAELRYELAKQLLIDNNMSYIKISTLLGYAEASVFTRSFRRWSGTTPSAWCMRHSTRSMHVGNEQLKLPS